MRKLTGSLLMLAMMLVPAWSAAQECNVNWQANAKKAKVGNTKKALKVTVPGHDVAMYRLSVKK